MSFINQPYQTRFWDQHSHSNFLYFLPWLLAVVPKIPPDPHSPDQQWPKTHCRTGPPSESCARRKSPLGCQPEPCLLHYSPRKETGALCSFPTELSSKFWSTQLFLMAGFALQLPCYLQGSLENVAAVLQLLQHRRHATWRVCAAWPTSQAEAGPRPRRCHLGKR